MIKETILVVEDEPLVGLEIKEDLENLGYIVPEIVTAGENVLPAVARHLPDLVIMDIRIDGAVDGIEAAYQMKAEFDLPVLYLTAYSDSQTLRRAAATGPDAFLLKPFSERELAANVEIILSKAKAGHSGAADLLHAIPLVDALEMAALVIDLEDRVVHANAQASALLRLDSSHLKGQSLANYIIAPGEGFEACLRSQCGVRAADGSSPEAIARIEPIVRADGKAIGSLVTFDRMTLEERLHLEHSVEAINKTLEGLVPLADSAGPGFEVRGFLVPCASGAGDLIDAFRIDRRYAAFYGLDVMGHGTLSSLVAYSLHNLIRGIARDREDEAFPSPSELVSRLNDRYADNVEGKPFFTIAYGSLDSDTGDFRIARAGHPPVLVLPIRGKIEQLYTKGTAVGVLDDLSVEEHRGRLEAGDRLIVVSDGYLESVGGLDFTAATEALIGFVEEYRGKELEAFVAALRELVADRRPQSSIRDDASLLVVERRA